MAGQDDECNRHVKLVRGSVEAQHQLPVRGGEGTRGLIDELMVMVEGLAKKKKKRRMASVGVETEKTEERVDEKGRQSRLRCRLGK